jgi:hypothetical protein
MAEHPSRTVLLISADDRLSRCSYCGQPIRWANTAKGKNMALQAKAHVEHRDDGPIVSSDDVHWAHCPHAKRAREAKQERDRRAADAPSAPSGPTRDDIYPPNSRGKFGAHYAGD